MASQETTATMRAPAMKKRTGDFGAGFGIQV